jgi:hypothetical protein
VIDLTEPRRRSYDLRTYPFVQLVRDHLNVADLSQLHETYPTPALNVETEQSTPLHRRLYDIGDEFADLYRKFVADWVRPLIGDEIIFQTFPNFRFRMPKSLAVCNWHRDIDNGHHESEINFWVPLTMVTEANCVWFELHDGQERPAPASLGEVLIFDGANKRHGNKPNHSNMTRVSFEFRVIPEERYQPRDEKSPVMGKQFIVGDYFDRLA